MKENQRLAKLFSDSYNGNPWLDVTILATLNMVSAETACRKMTPETNSIWEIVNHLIDWRANVLERVKGKILISPEHNYFIAVDDTSDAAWQNTMQNFAASQQKWLRFLNDFKDEDFEKRYLNFHSYYELIHGILHHDAYHLGQIVLLKKMA